MMDERHIAVAILNRKGYCCSQIMIKQVLKLQQSENPELVRAMAGLCFGGGFSGDTCGVLLGGTCIIALFGARGTDQEEASEIMPLMMAELVEWFKGNTFQNYGGFRCDDILGACPDRSACATLLVDTYEKTLEILVNHGFGPSRGNDG